MIIQGVKLEHFEAGNIFIIPDNTLNDNQRGEMFDLIITPALNKQEHYFKHYR